MFFRVAVYSVLILLAGACTSTGDKKEIDTTLEHKGTVGGAEVGFDKDNKAILQEEVQASAELKTQDWINNKLKEDLNQERHELQKCRDDLADPRLGGHGFSSSIPEPDDPSRSFDSEETGVNKNGEFVVVRKKGFTDRLKEERSFEKELRQILKVVKDIRRECEQKMRTARIQNGLPPARYKPEGYFTADGTWVSTSEGEQTLDDAFRIRAEKSEKKPGSRTS